MSNRTYGITSGAIWRRVNWLAIFCSSMPSTGTLKTPFGTSRFWIGHRRSVAITTMLGSGFTATGWPTAASSGESNTLSE